jgi:hypothetical protein
MADRRPPIPDRPPPTPADTPRRAERPISAREANSRRPASKFGAATDGWDAYNSWLDRVKQPAPPSRQAVIAKALYSVSSYKNWADKARGAFDVAAVPAVAPKTK